MKFLIHTAAFAVLATSVAIAPSNKMSDVEVSGGYGPTMDVVNMKPPGGDAPKSGPEAKGPGHGPTLDTTSTRGQWVSSYRHKVPSGREPTLDETSTRGKWVSKYRGSGPSDYWMPTGPAYLDLSDVGKERLHTHWVTMHDPTMHAKSGLFDTIKRFFNDRFV